MAETQTMPNGSVGAQAQEAGTAAAAQLFQKYGEERAKRLRDDGPSQYVYLYDSENFKHFNEDPWVEPNDPAILHEPLKDGDRCEVLIQGAGFGGILFAAHLVKVGFRPEDIRIVDTAGGFGGTWYWNRYPGLMCDIESYIYLPMLEELDYVPKHKYSYGPEIRQHCNNIVDKFGLRDSAMFQVSISTCDWDEDANEWIVKLTHAPKGANPRNMTVRPRFAFFAAGQLNFPQLPNLPGIDLFGGHAFHTARWDYKYTGGSHTDTNLSGLKDKRVGIIGTGASTVQILPHLSRNAKEVYVFQRTPSGIDVRGQRETDPEHFKAEIATGPGWQEERNANFNAFLSRADPLPSKNLVDDGWTKLGCYNALIGGPQQVTMDNVGEFLEGLHAADALHQMRIHRRIESIVEDRQTAEVLKPWYPTWCKRPCYHDEYLAMFNLPNTHLVDTAGKGLDRVTRDGVVVGTREYPLDCLIFSTGFRSPIIGTPASKANIIVRGRNGKSLEQKWRDEVGTLHGYISHEFPNLFWTGVSQSSISANYTHFLDTMERHMARIIATAAARVDPEVFSKVHTDTKSHKYNFTIEPTAEAEEAWTMRIMQGAIHAAALAGCTPGYLNNEGLMDRISAEGQETQMKLARGAMWANGFEDFKRVLREWWEDGQLEGLDVKAVK